jgi:hypothetical protein
MEGFMGTTLVALGSTASNDGVRWAVSWRARRTPRAKETGLTRRLGDDEQAEGSANDAYS